MDPARPNGTRKSAEVFGGNLSQTRGRGPMTVSPLKFDSGA